MDIIKTKGATVMKTAKLPITIQRRSTKATMQGKHELMIRRASNHNVHIITHHGKIQSGRKGRTA